MMPCIQFVVFRKHGKWLVRSAERNNETFPDQKAAGTAAVEAAQESGKNGKPAQVVMQNGKSFDTIWTYGRDPYPASLSF